jgi:hypothetical protein
LFEDKALAEEAVHAVEKVVGHEEQTTEVAHIKS